MLFSVGQAFVGSDEIRALLKKPTSEANLKRAIGMYPYSNCNHSCSLSSGRISGGPSNRNLVPSVFSFPI